MSEMTPEPVEDPNPPAGPRCDDEDPDTLVGDYVGR